MEVVSCDNWSYKTCKAPVKSSPTNQHPAFLQAGCPLCRPTNSVGALKGNILGWFERLAKTSLKMFKNFLSYTADSQTDRWTQKAKHNVLGGCISPILKYRIKYRLRLE